MTLFNLSKYNSVKFWGKFPDIKVRLTRVDPVTSLTKYYLDMTLTDGKTRSDFGDMLIRIGKLYKGIL